MQHQDGHSTAGPSNRRLDRNYEELEVLNDGVRRLMLVGVPGAAELYRKNRELLKQCERFRGKKVAQSGQVAEHASRALIESRELLERASSSDAER